MLRITEIRTKLAGGADFAATARESSDDSSRDTGGDLGCRPRGAYGDAFENAIWQLPLNTVSDPIKSEFGYHLLLVRERRTASFEEARPSLEQAVAQARGKALQEWLNEATHTAKVEVNPLYGQWDPVTGSTKPTGAQEPSLTLSPLDSSTVPAQQGTTGATR